MRQACRWACRWANPKITTTHVEDRPEISRDRGSNPLASIYGPLKQDLVYCRRNALFCFETGVLTHFAFFHFGPLILHRMVKNCMILPRNCPRFCPRFFSCVFGDRSPYRATINLQLTLCSFKGWYLKSCQWFQGSCGISASNYWKGMRKIFSITQSLSAEVFKIQHIYYAANLW